MKTILIVLAGFLSFSAFANDGLNSSVVKSKHTRVTNEAKVEAYDMINVGERNPHERVTNEAKDSDIKSLY